MPTTLLERAAGHVQTALPSLFHDVVPRPAPESVPWSTVVHDPVRGAIALTGRLATPPGARDLVLLVHGLGGSQDSWYLRAAAEAAWERGLASLRMSLRGADRKGADVYHAGLTVDLHAALQSEALRRFDRLAVWGFSLGGHVTLRMATEAPPHRLRAVAALSPPLDLAAGAAWIDAPARRPYLEAVLSGLREIHDAAAARGPGIPLTPDQAAEIHRLTAWDDRVIAPRFGFDDARAYWSAASVAPRLHRLQVPALLVHADADPMIGPPVVAAAFDGDHPRLTVRRVRWGGHVRVPRRTDLALGLPGSFRDQVLGWLLPERA